jgi:hypothetical protein
LGHLQVVTLYTSEKTTLSLHEKHYSLVSLLDGSSVGPVGISFVGKLPSKHENRL